jgi:hypothetical protein
MRFTTDELPNETGVGTIRNKFFCWISDSLSAQKSKQEMETISDLGVKNLPLLSAFSQQ